VTVSPGAGTGRSASIAESLWHAGVQRSAESKSARGCHADEKAELMGTGRFCKNVFAATGAGGRKLWKILER
jgi:hypothetical protein